MIQNYAHDTYSLLLAIHKYYNDSIHRSFSVHIVYVEIQHNASMLNIPSCTSLHLNKQYNKKIFSVSQSS